jgi:hypothetical protein
MKSSRILLILSLITIVWSLTAQTVNGQSQKLGVVSYTPVKGWTKTEKENIVTFSVVDSATGRFCFITLYGATPGTGDPQRDFKREWNNLVVTPFKADAAPKTETDTAGGWTIIAGGSALDFQGNKAIGLLSVMSSGSRTVSILGIFNDESYLPKLVAFNSGIEIEGTIAAPPPLRQDETRSAPSASSQVMNVNGLAKEFQDNEVRANQTWIGKRVRVNGIVNTIVIARDGNIELTFKTSITNYNMAKCLFNRSQSAGVAKLTAHTEATVEGTVRGLGGGFDNSKGFFLLENCVVP